MINIRKLAPTIQIDLRYATTNNFTGKKLYAYDQCYLNEPAANRLARVQKKLEREGLGLKIWDCYRPLSVQWQLWHVVPDARYVADPRNGSRHNRGASIDLTLVDKNGRELPMPTEFDDFSKKAHRDHTDLPKNILRNRNKLEKAMESEGFIGLPTEWWHFDDPEWKNYAVRDNDLNARALLKDKKSKAATFTLPKNVKQLVLVLSSTWSAPTAQLQRFERIKNKWKKAGKPWRVSLGKKGMGWGQGFQPAVGEGPQKREGDNKAPAGVFKIGQSYGIAKNAPEGSAWPYKKVDGAWRCVDDPKSAHYNQVFSLKKGQKKDWISAERMKRKDHVYDWVINIEQNFPGVLKGSGSCIFFHVWRRTASPTQGCTAMPEDTIKEFLTWLKPASNPILVQLPKSAYVTYKKFWKIP